MKSEVANHGFGLPATDNPAAMVKQAVNMAGVHSRQRLCQEMSLAGMLVNGAISVVLIWKVAINC